jgi:hypothetical protein
MAGSRIRRSKQFFVPVSPLEYYEGIREDFLCQSDDIEEYCVSIESHEVNNKVRLHAYLQFYNLLDVLDVRDCVSWFEGTINIQNVKSKRNVLKYITKEDKDAYFNCTEASLSYYRARAWSTRTRTFRYDDPFVLEYPQYYRLLSELHREVAIRSNGNKPTYKCPEMWWPGWCMSVLLSMVKKIRGRMWQSVYIYEPSGVGKTFIVKECFRCLGISNIYMPVPGRFFFGDFQPRFYDCVLFEELKYLYFVVIFPSCPSESVM